ncbi:xanthine dehydrogenase accessory protein XdhC [Verminephrobacter eiseniae]|uniref:xanthine dehydrogenase accessory protein XdhC n=1 Tax=Verminephrobacter eiseniae TaxID=364317 RepID=UPI0038B3A4C6
MAMMALGNLRVLLDGLSAGPACLVTVASTRGSAPREPGAWMAVFADRLVGSIGGGHLELQAITEARRRLAHGADAGPMRFALGPALGQCCGGVVHLGFERLSAADAPGLARRLAPCLQPVALFGAGHVGQALARVLAPLPFALTWIDSRDGIFAPDPPPGVVCEHSEPVQGAVPALAAGSRVLIMSFCHAEDLELVAACLRRQRAQQDLRFIGLIGSQPKWATFSRRLRGRGFSAQELAHVTCPIGIPGIAGKQPEVIAVAVAAQLLQTL